MRHNRGEDCKVQPSVWNVCVSDAGSCRFGELSCEEDSISGESDSKSYLGTHLSNTLSHFPTFEPYIHAFFWTKFAAFLAAFCIPFVASERSSDKLWHEKTFSSTDQITNSATELFPELQSDSSFDYARSNSEYSWEWDMRFWER